LTAFECGVKTAWVQEIRRDRLDRLPPSAFEHIDVARDRPHGMSPLNERRHKMRADIPGSAEDCDSHGR
jgi:hypothetical protein